MGEICSLTMSYITPKVLAYNDVPCRSVLSVELLLDVGSYVFFDVVFFESCRRDVHALLLHLLAHVDVLYDGLGASDTASGVLCMGPGVGGRGGAVEFCIHCSMRYVGVCVRIWSLG